MRRAPRIGATLPEIGGRPAKRLPQTGKGLPLPTAKEG
jgi:hypothetical protein